MNVQPEIRAKAAVLRGSRYVFLTDLGAFAKSFRGIPLNATVKWLDGHRLGVPMGRVAPQFLLGGYNVDSPINDLGMSLILSIMGLEPRRVKVG